VTRGGLLFILNIRFRERERGGGEGGRGEIEGE
jgi:hypothetical protein